jgi:rubrerythrin
VASEEKTHYDEFQTMLLKIDKEQARELDKGKREVKKLTGKKS